MNLDDFSTVVEDRRYINPQVGLDEQNAFIENFREAQRRGADEISEQTYNLGTAVPSSLGGLGGAGTYFESRYQTPQVNEMVANLKATAQAQALSDAMSNELAQAKQRYNRAYKSYQKRAGRTTLPSPTSPEGGVDYEETPLETKDRPDINDYISEANFYNMGNLFGESRKYPLSVDTPMSSTTYELYTRNIKNPEDKTKAWIDFLDSVGYGG